VAVEFGGGGCGVDGVATMVGQPWRLMKMVVVCGGKVMAGDDDCGVKGWRLRSASGGRKNGWRWPDNRRRRMK
nr:hypothetical protein [Tanacetum cinerariifolium]